MDWPGQGWRQRTLGAGVLTGSRHSGNQQRQTERKHQITVHSIWKMSEVNENLPSTTLILLSLVSVLCRKHARVEKLSPPWGPSLFSAFMSQWAFHAGHLCSQSSGHYWSLHPKPLLTWHPLCTLMYSLHGPCFLVKIYIKALFAQSDTESLCSVPAIPHLWHTYHHHLGICC